MTRRDHQVPPDAERTLLDFLARVWRSTVWRAVAGLLVAVLVGAALYASWLYDQTLQDECQTWLHVDPTMEELLDFKRRLEAYQGDPTPGAQLVLSGEELSYLVGDRDEFHLHARFVGSELSALMAIPAEDGCYNIEFRGEVEIDDGVAQVSPDYLVVGDADLTWIASQRTWQIQPDERMDERSVKLLKNTKRMRVENGQAFIRLDNRWDVW